MHQIDYELKHGIVLQVLGETVKSIVVQIDSIKLQQRIVKTDYLNHDVQLQQLYEM
jgi:hypothetical protein